MEEASYVVLGAGVIGLTTALQLKEQDPACKITVVAKHFPGDQSIEYTSPWAGADWDSFAVDNGRHERWDAVTYRKLGQLADNSPESGVRRVELRKLFDLPIDQAGVYSEGTERIWYEELVGGFRHVPKNELREGNCFGFDYASYVIDIVLYLPWSVQLQDLIL